MVASHNEALDNELEYEDSEPQQRNANGTFAKGNSGNPGGMGSTAGVVAYVKSITNDCFEMVDLFVTVMRGEKLQNSDFVAGPKERMQAASELFDRAIGKPKQTIEETGDGHGKEVLASLQALLHVRSTGDTTDTPIAPDDSKLTAIDQMKARMDKGETERPYGGVRL